MRRLDRSCFVKNPCLEEKDQSQNLPQIFVHASKRQCSFFYVEAQLFGGLGMTCKLSFGVVQWH